MGLLYRLVQVDNVGAVKDRPLAVRDYGGAMLKRDLRLRQKSLYRKVFAQGKSFSGKYVVIYVAQGPSKIGFIASKKVGNAVVRNRAKRLMREVIRNHLLEIKDNKQIICIARSSIKGVSYSQVENSLLVSLKMAQAIKEQGKTR